MAATSKQTVKDKDK